jgi:hypothetical protein
MSRNTSIDRWPHGECYQHWGVTSFLYNALKTHHPVRPELVEGPTPSVGFDRLNPNGWIWMGDQPVASVSQTRTGSAGTLAVQTSVGYIYADHLNTPRVIARSGDHGIIWRRCKRATQPAWGLRCATLRMTLGRKRPTRNCPNCSWR